jgi:hypothetical protein
MSPRRGWGFLWNRLAKKIPLLTELKCVAADNADIAEWTVKIICRSVK